MAWSAKGRHNKKTPRQYVADFHSRPSRGMVLLPGYECEELYLLQQRGVLTSDTNCLFIEREPATLVLVKRQVALLWKEWGFTKPPVYHDDEAALIAEVPFKVDLIHYDLFGNLTFDDVIALRDVILPQLTKSGGLFITFSTATRGNMFIPAITNRLEDIMASKFHETVNLLVGKNLTLNERRLIATYSLLFDNFLFGQSESCVTAVYQDERSEGMMIQMCARGSGVPQLHIEDYYTPTPQERTRPMNATAKPKTNAVSGIARMLLEAKTPGQKAAATKKYNAYKAQRVSEGASEERVEAGIKAAQTKMLQA